MPRAVRASIRTLLSVRELAAIFEAIATDMYGVRGRVGGFARRFSGYGATEFEFFTPRDNSPFAVLDERPPAFTVGVQIPKFGGQGGGVVTLQMYVWDEDDKREAEFYSPHSWNTSSSARKAVERAVEAVKAADPQALAQYST